MTDILLYSNQPVLAAGLRVSLSSVQGLRLAGISATVAQLFEQMAAISARLVLVDLTADVTLEVLDKIHSKAPGSAVILWVDGLSTEFAAQVIGLGIRGILRKTIAIEQQLRCLESVAAGELWLEKSLSDRILSTNRVNLTRRERELLGLLAQGFRNKEMAYELGITEGTVKVYLSHLFRKVGASDRLDLALFALRNMIAPGAVGSWDPAELRDPAPSFVPGFLGRPAA